jgi:aspartyl-tRNA(Asn)/glutamyl-tRNA(Gln) amidotransferase subunit C
MPETSSPPAGAASITRDDVVNVARLARLTLSDAELDMFTGQLAAVLDHARDVEALDVADVPPMSHPYPLVNVLRDDVAGPTLTEMIAHFRNVRPKRRVVGRRWRRTVKVLLAAEMLANPLGNC